MAKIFANLFAPECVVEIVVNEISESHCEIRGNVTSENV